MGRARARELIASGAVLCNERKVRKGQALVAGDRLRVMLDEMNQGAQPDPALPLDVRFEDARLVVVHKPAGVPCHPLRPGELGCLANALLHRYPEMNQVGYDERQPGLVNRLDNDTSGLVLAARDPSTFDELVHRLRAGDVDKRYQALVDSEVEAPQRLDWPLAPHPSNARKMLACVTERDQGLTSANEARSEVLSCEPRNGRFLVELRAHRALRHQIRAHLAAAGAPIVGDVLYGGSASATRHLLHAGELSLDWEGSRLSVSASLPADWP